MARARRSNDARSDRLTRLLVALAIVLAIVAVVIAVDIGLRPAPERPAEQVSRLNEPPPLVETPRLLPSPTPTHGTPPPCTAPSDWGIHIVQKADTLYSLGTRHSTDVRTLQRVNCLEDSTILVGQQLYVPGPAALPTHATPTPRDAHSAPPSSTPELDLPVGETAQVPVEMPTIVPPSPALVEGPQSGMQATIPDKYLHIILLGTDLRPVERIHSDISIRGKRNVWRTDAMIVVSLDLEENEVRVLNFPRDLYVYIPEHGYNRINTAATWAELEEAGSGGERVKQTLYQNFGIPVHYYVKMDFEGFVNIVNALGGVDVDVECPYPLLELEPGIHHLDGAEALLYVHKRVGSDDFDRKRRQRTMMMALWEQALTPGIIAKLPQLWVTLGDSFQTDLPLEQVISLAYRGLQLRPQDIEMTSIGDKQTDHFVTPEGAWVLKPREEAIRELLEDLYAPKAETVTEKVDKVRVQVLNGSGRFQAEELAATALRRKGLKVIDKGQADQQDYEETQIRIFKGDPIAGEWIAERLNVPLSAIQDLTTAPDPPDHSNPVDIKVVLGADYDPCQR